MLKLTNKGVLYIWSVVRKIKSETNLGYIDLLGTVAEVHKVKIVTSTLFHSVFDFYNMLTTNIHFKK